MGWVALSQDNYIMSSFTIKKQTKYHSESPMHSVLEGLVLT
jgi:hypothetical protein